MTRVNIQEYIESGVLELYAMGALPPAEMKEVEEHAEAHPEIRAEIQAIEETLGQLAAASSRAPRPELKQEILGRIGASSPASASPAPAPTIPISTPTERSTASAASPPPSRGRSYLMAASFIVGLVGIGLALYFNSRLGETEKELATAIAQRDQVARSANEMRDRLQKVETDMVVLRNPEFRTVMMKGTPNAPGAEAIVHWHPTSRQVYIDITKMPPAPNGHRYQLWALTEAGPVDAGLFQGSDSPERVSMQPMKEISTANTFAVTIEPEGGSAAPTLEKMVVSGAL